MKRLIIVLGALTLLGATAYAQTQKTNRTKTKTHDRSELIQGDTSKKAQADKAAQETDMDRNNPDKNTTPAKPANSDTPK